MLNSPHTTMRPQYGPILSVLLSTAIFSGWCQETDSETRSDQDSECGHEKLVKCAYPLKVFEGNQDISFAAKREELEQLCPNLEEGLRCIDRFTRKCFKPSQRSHFNLLYADTSMVIHEICHKGPNQDEFLKHAPCMKEVKDDYDECARDYQQKLPHITEADKNSDKTNATNNIKKLCCSFRDYLRCTKAIVMDRCGEDTARFTEDFLRRMSISFVKVHCEQVNLSSDSVCTDLDSSVSRSQWSPVILILTLAVVQVFRVHFYN